jgi:uncharacterized protein GlcG (DUF336 family)
VSISIDMAHRIVDACRQRALELRSPVSIAVVDAGGHLVLFERMMAPYGWATGNICIAKATTAVMFNQPTDSVAQWGSAIPGFASSMASMTDGKFIMAAGGWPVRIGGVTVGGIGISGGNAAGRDDEIARAGLAAVNAAPVPPIQPVPPGQSYTGILPQVPATPLYPPSSSASPQQARQPDVQGEAQSQNTANVSGPLPPRQEQSNGINADQPSSEHSGDRT